MRIHQFLNKTGKFQTKQQAIHALKQGQIKIGNKTITSENHFFNEKKERVYYKDELIKLKEEKTIALNKPPHYVCAKLTQNDRELGKKSVYDLIPKNLQHISCIGRLDEESVGLLLMTNNGDMHHKIISKENNTIKKYEVQLKDEITEKEIQKLMRGVTIQLEENGKIKKYKTKPCKIKKINKHEIEIIITEGKKRQIRRMIQTINNEVIKLKRTQIANLKLNEKDLPEGKYKEIKLGEIKI